MERCSNEGIQAHNLITVGAQHQGVANAPGCRCVICHLSNVNLRVCVCLYVCVCVCVCVFECGCASVGVSVWVCVYAREHECVVCVHMCVLIPTPSPLCVQHCP